MRVGPTRYVPDMQLTRSRIIATAIELIEADGIEAVTMHRLATELGCSLISLYSYVPSTSALLDGVGHQVMSAVKTSPMPNECWQERLLAQARAFRSVAREHPRCTMLAISRPPTSARMARPAEAALAALRDAGFADQDAVWILRTLLAYIVGSILRDVGIAPGLASSEPVVGSKRWLSAEPDTHDPEADFEFGLDLLMRAVTTLRPVACSPGSATRSSPDPLLPTRQ